MPRDEFSPNTKKLLAKRVSYKCSNPACRRITVGANSDSNKTTNIGVASHIYAAAPGGPRYNAEMTVEERKSPDNGIWLCQSCSVMIDKDTEMYPIQLLKQWKEEAEQEAKDAVNNRLSAMDSKFRDYYQHQIDAFEMSMDDDSIVGDEPLESAYMEAYTINEGKKDNMLDAVEQWYEGAEKRYVLLLRGQPGDGKTTFCKKAVYEFAKGRRFQKRKPKHVLWFQLNQPGLISGKNVYVENIFHETDTQNTLATWNELKDSIIFLDGFDEIKLQLADTAYPSWERFSNLLRQLANKHHIHFIVTSRFNALIGEPLGNHCTFAPLDYEKQASYCTGRDRYTVYWNNYLEKICKETEDGPRFHLKQLLEIPFIFRMVIEQQYQINDAVNNQAKLYEDLFFNTFRKHELSDTEIEDMNCRYQALAYNIWCDDEDTAEISQEYHSDMSVEKIRNKLLFSYYLKHGVSKRLGYIHRSFYQYYLALYFYEGMKQQEPEEFLKLLAERIIDNDVLGFFTQIAGNKREDEATESARKVIEKLDETEAVIATSPKNINGNAEKSIFNRCNNIFYNGIQLCFIFDVVEKFNQSEKVKRLLGKYNSQGLQLYPQDFGTVCLNKHIDLQNVEMILADLSNANLSNAYLRNADLINASLRNADLSGAHLSGAHLNYADLSYASLLHANLSDADLWNAYLCNTSLLHADLSYANLSYASLLNADLSYASLLHANLSDADLRNAYLWNTYLLNADLRNADLRNADLSGANLRDADICHANLAHTKMGICTNSNSEETSCTLLVNTKITIGALDNVDTSGVDLSEVIWCDKNGNPIS